MSKRFAPNGATPQHTAARVRSEIDTQKVEYGRVKATVRDRNGNIVGHVDQKVDSLLTNFWSTVYQTHAEILTQNYPVLSGGTSSTNSRRCNSDGPLEGYSGIIVGSGTTAVSYAQTALAALIEHGVGTGRLSAHDTSVNYDPVTNTVEIVRTFTNADTNAADITVRECGICFSIDTASAQGNARMYCRDVFDSELVIPFEGNLTVVYTITFANGNANYTRILNALGYRSRNDGFTLSNIVNTTGTAFSGSTSQQYGFLAIEGDDNNGLVVGTANSTPTALNTWDIESKVSHGTGAGQLFYYQSTISSFEENTVTNSCRWYLNRVVQNRSGNTINIREIGLFCNITVGATNTVFMVDRKFPDDGVVPVTNGSFATLSWEFCYNL